VFSFLRWQVPGEVLKGERQGQLPQVLWAALRRVSLCSGWDLRQQGRVPLLQGQDDRCRQEEAAQVPRIHG